MDGKQKLGKKNLQYSPEQIASHAASPPPHTPARTAASRRPFTTLPVHGAKGGGKLRSVGTKWGGLLGWEIIWNILTGCDRSVTIRFREF